MRKTILLGAMALVTFLPAALQASGTSDERLCGERGGHGAAFLGRLDASASRRTSVSSASAIEGRSSRARSAA